MMQGGEYPTYTRYDPDTGEIICSFTGDPNLLELWPDHIEGKYDADEYYVADGVAVLKPEADRGAMRKQIAHTQMINVRNGLLAASDWTQSPDSPLTEAKKQDWASYRQTLRDLPANTADPSNPAWPAKP
jgi:hypothetical protein